MKFLCLLPYPLSNWGNGRLPLSLLKTEVLSFLFTGYFSTLRVLVLISGACTFGTSRLACNFALRLCVSACCWIGLGEKQALSPTVCLRIGVDTDAGVRVDAFGARWFEVSVGGDIIRWRDGCRSEAPVVWQFCGFASVCVFGRIVRKGGELGVWEKLCG